MLILGQEERARVEAIRERLSAETVRMYEEADTYHDRKWVMFDETLPDTNLTQLLAIKRRPNKVAASPQKNNAKPPGDFCSSCDYLFEAENSCFGRRMSLMRSYVLQTDKVSKSFGKTEVLHEVDLSIARGEVYGLIGQNGAGKTTLLRMVGGLIAPTKGTIRRFTEKPLLGYMPQSCRFDDGSSVGATIRMFARLRGADAGESLALSERLQLDWTKRVKRLSPGQQKKLQMILAMTGDPELFILDEPTAGLDPGATFEMKRMIQSLHQNGKSILVSSHILQDMDEICTNVAIMVGGRLTCDKRLGSCFVFQTSPVTDEALGALRQKYQLSADAAGTTLTAQIEKVQVPELIAYLSSHHIQVFEASPANVKTMVQQELQLGQEAKH